MSDKFNFPDIYLARSPLNKYLNLGELTYSYYYGHYFTNAKSQRKKIRKIANDLHILELQNDTTGYLIPKLTPAYQIATTSWSVCPYYSVKQTLTIIDKANPNELPKTLQLVQQILQLILTIPNDQAKEHLLKTQSPRKTPITITNDDNLFAKIDKDSNLNKYINPKYVITNLPLADNNQQQSYFNLAQLNHYYHNALTPQILRDIIKQLGLTTNNFVLNPDTNEIMISPRYVHDRLDQILVH